MAEGTYLVQGSSEASSDHMCCDLDKGLPSKIGHLILAFLMILVPMLAIPLILLAFFFYSDIRPNLSKYQDASLPIDTDNISPNHYYTTERYNVVLDVTGWASTAGQFIMAPYMLLFSFFVAKSIVGQHPRPSNLDDLRSQCGTDYELLQGVHKGAWQDMLKSFFSLIKHTFTQVEKKRPLRVAAIGATFAGAFT